MDRKEDILAGLEEFNRNPPAKVPDLLERYLQRIAVTGETLFEWDVVKPLFMNKLEVCMKEFNNQVSSDLLYSSCQTLETSKLDAMRKRLIKTAETFTGAPFTIQRLCELMTDPYKHYQRTDKYFRGIEKNIQIVSTVDPLGRKVVSESYKCVANGVQDEPSDEPSELRTPEKVRSPFLPPPPANSPCTTDWFTATTSSDKASPLLLSWQQGGGGDAPSATITSEATPAVSGSRIDHSSWEAGFDDYLHTEGPPEKKARFTDSRSEPSQSCVDYFSTTGLRPDKSDACDSISKVLDPNGRATLSSDSCLGGVSSSVLSSSVSSTEMLTHSATDSIPTDSLSKIQSTVDSISTHVRHSIGESLAESGVTSLSPSECLVDEDAAQMSDDRADNVPEPSSHYQSSQEELADRRESQGFDVCPMTNTDSSSSNSSDSVDNSSDIADTVNNKSSDITDPAEASSITEPADNSSDIADSADDMPPVADSSDFSAAAARHYDNPSTDFNLADSSPSQSSSHSQSPVSEQTATGVSSSSESVQSPTAIVSDTLSIQHESDKPRSSDQPDDGTTEVSASSSVTEPVADSCTDKNLEECSEQSETPESSDSEAIPSTNEAALISQDSRSEPVHSSADEMVSTASSSADPEQQHEQMDTA